MNYKSVRQELISKPGSTHRHFTLMNVVYQSKLHIVDISQLSHSTKLLGLQTSLSQYIRLLQTDLNLLYGQKESEMSKNDIGPIHHHQAVVNLTNVVN